MTKFGPSIEFSIKGLNPKKGCHTSVVFCVIARALKVNAQARAKVFYVPPLSLYTIPLIQTPYPPLARWGVISASPQIGGEVNIRPPPTPNTTNPIP